MNRYETVAAVGLDVHYKFSTVSMRDAKGRVVRRERLEHSGRAQLREVLSLWPQGVPYVMEASFGWGWLSDEMQQAGLDVMLSNCYKLEQMRKARSLPKTNEKDAGLLSLLPFEKDPWWRVWMAPPEVRDRREFLRYRASLVQIQTQTKNRISALFHRHGIFHECSDLFGAQGRKFLEQLCQSGRTPEVALPNGAWMALQGLVKVLGHVREQLAAVSGCLRKLLDHTPLAKRLDGIPGIGLVLAHTLMAEIGQIERFRSHGALARYSVLAPIAQDTGEPDPAHSPMGRHLGHRGNLTLKWAFLEAAHGAVKSGGRWRVLFDAVTQGGRKDRNRGYIKVARELVKVVYVVWRKGLEYSERPAPRPGSHRASKHTGNTRSGTGQSYHPMAVA